MILVEAGELSLEAFEAKVLFAVHRHRRGYRTVIDDRTRPDGLSRNLKSVSYTHLDVYKRQAIRRLHNLWLC